MAGRGLVLGGGGVTGIAWELGLLAGLAEEGVDLTGADVVVGTSAGSVVGSIVTSSEPLNEAYERQLQPVPASGSGSSGSSSSGSSSGGSGAGSAEKAAKVGLGLILRYASVALVRDEQRARARVGALALATKTVTERERREIIAARLRGMDWPSTQRLLVTAVAADDGEFVVFDSSSGVSLVDAVGASCAVPGVWPAVTINGRRYVDGGTRSPANVDLAAGCEAVVVLAPITVAFRRAMRASVQLAALPPGTRRVLVTPNAQARQAIGRNVLDPARRAPAARAGKLQATAVAAAVRAVWNAS